MDIIFDRYFESKSIFLRYEIIFKNNLDPHIYPASNCCNKCVYVDIESNLNGSIICPNCKLILIDFVYYREDDRNSIQTSH